MTAGKSAEWWFREFESVCDQLNAMEARAEAAEAQVATVKGLVDESDRLPTLDVIGWKPTIETDRIRAALGGRLVTLTGCKALDRGTQVTAKRVVVTRIAWPWYRVEVYRAEGGGPMLSWRVHAPTRRLAARKVRRSLAEPLAGSVEGSPS